MNQAPNWHAKPDRTDDPAIRRNALSRIVTAGARRKTKGRSFQFMRVLAINGRLFLPYLLWNSRMMPNGKLTRQQTEAVIIRVAWLCQSEYEWIQHKAIGRRNELSEEQVEAAGPDSTSDLFDDEIKALLAAVPELLENHVLSDESYDALRAFLSPALILEFIMLVGTYAALAGALNSFGVPLEETWADTR
ncbi:MAG: carboxymuconolactone decarboxylase family protein [Thermoleophilaceae bacterium]|nr:carboxymuconolactone decarboxylase family protein [Thermoleophilaceae bacterium]